MATSQTFSVRLREAREARGLRQSDLAAQLGTSRISIIRWEAGAHAPRGIALKVAEAWIARVTKKGGRRGA